MIDRRWLLVLLACATGCFSPTHIDAEESGSTAAASGATTPGEADESSATDEAPTGPSGGDDPTGGSAGGGPQLMRSVPEDGDAHAPLHPSFSLYFDREVDPNDAVSHLLVSRNGGATMPVSPRQCWPDADPTCIAADFPAGFLDGPDALAGDSAITVQIGPDFADPDGNTNTEEQVVDFHTFAYEREVVANGGYIRGLDFDPGTSALFTLGELEVTHTGTVVQKIGLPGGVPAPALTVALMVDQIDCDGLDVNYGILYVGCGAEVYMHDGLDADDLQPVQYMYTPDPPDLLAGTWSVAHAGDAGTLYAGSGKSAIAQYDLNGSWKQFHDGAGLWAAPYGVMVASGPELVTDVVYAGAANHVYAFSLPDGAMASDVALDEAIGLDYEFDMEVDSHGHLWLGTSAGIYVLDPTAAYATLASRVGLDASRLAIREDGATVHAYYVAHGASNAPIGHVAIEL